MDTIHAGVTRCADVIAQLDHRLVIIERLTPPFGYALPGGKLNYGETPVEGGAREFLEETGLLFEFKGILGIYDAPGRDPRGDYISTVIYGSARGTPKAEGGKTRIILLPPKDVLERKDKFVCDHATMLADYLAKIGA